MLGIFSSSIWGLVNEEGMSAEEAIGFLRNLGITGIETSSGELDSRGKDEFKKLLEDNGMSVCCVHHICRMTAKDDAIFEETIKAAEKAIDDAIYVGAEYFMLVPSYPEDVEGMEDKERARKRMTEALNRTTDYAGDKPITIIIENFSIPRYPFSTIDDLAYIVENAPEMRLNLDAGNFRCVDNDVLEAYDRLKEHFAFVHFKDWKYIEEGGILTPDGKHLGACTHGEGCLPLRELLSKLKADGYNGWYIIEQDGNMQKERVPVSAELIKNYAF